MSELIHGRLRSKRGQLELALVGQLKEHHRFMLVQHLSPIDYLDE